MGHVMSHIGELCVVTHGRGGTGAKSLLGKFVEGVSNDR